MEYTTLYSPEAKGNRCYKSCHNSQLGGIAQICIKLWFQITADAHSGVSGVSKDQKFSEQFKNTHCQVDHPAKIE